MDTRKGTIQRTLGKVNVYWYLVLPLVVFVTVLYVYPVLKVLWISFKVPVPGFHNYKLLFTNKAIQQILSTTIKLCFWTTAISMTVAYIISYVMVHVSPRHRMWMTLFILIPFWMSVLVRAFSWLTLLRDKGLVNSVLMGLDLTQAPLHLVRNELGVLIGMVHYMVPYAVLPLYANMRGIDQRIINASRSLGAGPFRTFVRVFLPLSLPGIVASGILVFIITIGFFVTPSILGGGKTVMIAEYVSVQILQVVSWGTAAMLSSCLLIAVFLLLFVLSKAINLRELFGAK